MHTTMNDYSEPELIKLWQRALLVVSFHDLGAWVAKRAPFEQDDIRWGAGWLLGSCCIGCAAACSCLPEVRCAAALLLAAACTSPPEACLHRLS